MADSTTTKLDEKFLSLAVDAIEDKKGIDTKVIDISKISVIADYFIITSGNNINQVQSIADEVEERLSKAGLHTRQVEGYEKANWILLDFGDLVIHVFDKASREFYNIERIWRDGENWTK